MSYLLKHFDTELLTFNMSVHVLEGFSVEIVKIHTAHQPLLPLDLELSNAGLLSWLRRRVIPKNRAFVQSFLAKLGLNVQDTKGIIEICKGLSLNDCYWIVTADFQGSFAKYNLYDHPFSRILSLIAYTGYGETQPSRFASTPELTTGGMLAKCWRRIGGKILLYKAGSTGAANAGNEPYSEFYAYQIAHAMGLSAVEYQLHRWKGQLFSSCELFTHQALSYIPTGHLVRAGGWQAVFDFYQKLGEKYHDDLLDMLIFDAVICNEDRHFGNFGLLIDAQYNRIQACAPLFDNGLSLFNYAMPEDLTDVDAYARTRLMRDGQDFLSFTQAIIRPSQKQKLRKLIQFKFKKHARYNLPNPRLSLIESFIQKRVQTLLAL